MTLQTTDVRVRLKAVGFLLHVRVSPKPVCLTTFLVGSQSMSQSRAVVCFDRLLSLSSFLSFIYFRTSIDLLAALYIYRSIMLCLAGCGSSFLDPSLCYLPHGNTHGQIKVKRVEQVDQISLSLRHPSTRRNAVSLLLSREAGRTSRRLWSSVRFVCLSLSSAVWGVCLASAACADGTGRVVYETVCARAEGTL